MKRFSLIFLCLISLTSIAAQSISVELSRDSILLGNSFTIKFEIENSDGKFEAPDFRGCVILSGPNMASSYQYLNGESSRSTSYSYVLKPLEIGELIIDQAYLLIGDKELSTDFIKVDVYPNPDGIIQEDSPMQTEFRFNLPWDTAKQPKLQKPTKQKRKLKKI